MQPKTGPLRDVARVLNVAGYYWHFRSEDCKLGGHVLDYRVRDGRAQYDVCHDWEGKLPDSRRFNEANLTEDFSQDVKQVHIYLADEQRVSEVERGQGGEALLPASPGESHRIRETLLFARSLCRAGRLPSSIDGGGRSEVVREFHDGSLALMFRLANGRYIVGYALGEAGMLFRANCSSAATTSRPGRRRSPWPSTGPDRRRGRGRPLARRPRRGGPEAA